MSLVRNLCFQSLHLETFCDTGKTPKIVGEMDHRRRQSHATSIQRKRITRQTPDYGFLPHLINTHQPPSRPTQHHSTHETDERRSRLSNDIAHAHQQTSARSPMKKAWLWSILGFMGNLASSQIKFLIPPLTIPSHRLRTSVSVAVEKVNGCARPGLDMNKD